MYSSLRTLLIGGVAMTGVSLGLVAVKLNNNIDNHIATHCALDDFKASDARKQSADSIRRFMTINGIPGVSVGVSIDGEVVWRDGFGYACVETNAPCTKNTIMCIASISKSVTATLAARLVDTGALDLDRSIYDYLEPDDFPRKTVKGESVDITTRQLLSHTAGIRHYTKKDCISDEIDKKINETLEAAINNRENESVEDVDNLSENWQKELLDILKYQPVNEFHLNSHFESVWDALELFKYDGLVARPGDQFYYTTHGFTLAAAVIERAFNKHANKNKNKNDETTEKKKDRTFESLMTSMFKQLGMLHTFVDDHKRIVPHRARYYQRDPKTHKLENTPQVNNSYKFAGGGLLSDVTDLLTLGNVILYSYQNHEPCSPKPFIRRKTAEQLWSITAKNAKNYGLGWLSATEATAPIGGISPEKNSGYWYHTGAAIGASSILLTKPSVPKRILSSTGENRPRGVCVAILANCYGIGGIATLAREIADAFESEYIKCISDT